MTNLQKMILSWLGIALVVIIAIFFLVDIKQMTETATTTNTVSFDGEGKISAKPDIAVADFSIVTEAATSKAAQDDNSTKSQKLINYLKSQKIDDKDVKTTGYNIYPQYNYIPCLEGNNIPCISNQIQKIKSYQVSQSVEVKIRNLDNVSTILDGAVATGVNQVGDLNFQIDNPESLKDQARALAIADAKGKADTLKKQLGINLGRIINYTEGGQGYIVPMAYEKSAGTAMGGSATPAVPSGENQITVDVTVTYQVK
jgi:uncharacterized protein YggE